MHGSMTLNEMDEKNFPLCEAHGGYLTEQQYDDLVEPTLMQGYEGIRGRYGPGKSILNRC